jgi:hypothetical protein
VDHVAEHDERLRGIHRGRLIHEKLAVNGLLDP